MIIFKFSGVNLQGCNHLWKWGQKKSKFWLNLGVGNARFNIESPLIKIESWNLPHWWLLYWFTKYPRIVPKWASWGKIRAVKTQKILKLSPWKDILDDKKKLPYFASKQSSYHNFSAQCSWNNWRWYCGQNMSKELSYIFIFQLFW